MRQIGSEHFLVLSRVLHLTPVPLDMSERLADQLIRNLWRRTFFGNKIYRRPLPGNFSSDPSG